MFVFMYVFVVALLQERMVKKKAIIFIFEFDVFVCVLFLNRERDRSIDFIKAYLIIIIIMRCSVKYK